MGSKSDWTAVGIGILTLIVGAGGIFVPDWIASGRVTARHAYTIVAVLAVLIVICLIVQQIALREAEAEQEERDRVREARERAQYELLREILRRQAQQMRERGEGGDTVFETIILGIAAYDALLGDASARETIARFARDEGRSVMTKSELSVRAEDLTRRALGLSPRV